MLQMNFGLHDCWSQQKVAPADYTKNLEAIYEAAHAGLAPGGKILWVPTTPTGNNTYKVRTALQPNPARPPARRRPGTVRALCAVG